jgi:ADP-heptose:LPS heptosyltransferase
MNVKTLLQADRWLGVPLCFVLSMLRWVFGRAQPDCSKPPGNILIVKLAEQGSTVLAYPALRRAVEIAGRDNVYFIALEENRFILDALGVIPEQNVIAIPNGGPGTLLCGGWSALRRLWKLKLDAAVDMEFFSRGSAALTLLSRARRRVGFHAYFGAGPYRGNLMTHRLLYNPHLHTSDTFLSLVEAVLREPASLPTFDFKPSLTGDEPPRFAATDAEIANVADLIRCETGSRPPLLLLNPNASDLLPLRRWPTERYVELAKRLLEKFPESFVAFTGAPNEAAAAARLVQQIGSNRCVSFAGKTTLRELLILYSHSRVLVTNDSGPAHFATLTPIHVVTMFGPETPALFGARTPRNTVLWAGIACSPCVSAYNNRQSSCRDNQCMQAITVDQVFAATCRAYEQAGATSTKQTAA